MKLSEKDMAAYRATAERRWHEERQQLSLRYERAWSFARKSLDLQEFVKFPEQLTYSDSKETIL